MNTPSETFYLLKEYFESKPACRRAIGHLNNGVEISIVLDETEECALFRSGPLPTFEARPAKAPDVVFKITSIGARKVVECDGAEVGKLGIAVLRQYLDKQVRIQVLGSMLAIMTRGYLGIITEGGAEFAKFLASHGVANLSKIPGIIKDLRKTP